MDARARISQNAPPSVWSAFISINGIISCQFADKVLQSARRSTQLRGITGNYSDNGNEESNLEVLGLETQICHVSTKLPKLKKKQCTEQNF